jgi:AcrR family transcriptional regulator
VTSARTLFATAGLETSVEDVTRHAGVGMGTLYRHFATKEELIDAVLEDAFAEFLGAAESALEEPDPWTGFCMFFEHAVALQAENRGLKDVVATRAHGLTRAAAMRRQLRPLLVRLVERAQEQGSLRPDFAAQDVALLLWGTDGVIECGATVAPEIWRRYVGFMLDGLRSEAATPQAHAPLTRAQVDRATRSAR